MASTAANQPHVIKLRMKIDQKVAVGGVFVLANTRFRNRRIFQRGQTPGKTLTHLSQSLAGHHSIAGVRIEFGSVTVNRDLDAAPFEIRQTISFVFEIDPGGQGGCGKTAVAGRSSEIENL